MTTATHKEINGFECGDCCPVHARNPHKNVYTFGSSMTAETEVCVFFGCKCAVAIAHDPIGTYPSRAILCESYNEASGIGRLRAADWSAKLAD